MSTFTNEEFKTLVEDYIKELNVKPTSAHHLLNFSREKNLKYRYGAINKAFQAYLREEKENKNNLNETTNNDSNTPTPTPTPSPSPTKSPSPIKSPSPTKSVASNYSSDSSRTTYEPLKVDWEDVWSKYKEEYSCSPRESYHLWNFTKDLKLNIKYKTARNAFRKLKKKHKSDKEENESKHTKQKIKIDELNKEKLKELVSKYIQMYSYPPKNAKQLFNFCKEFEHMAVKYKAINVAFKKWYKPPKIQKHIETVISTVHKSPNSHYYFDPQHSDEGQQSETDTKETEPPKNTTNEISEVNTELLFLSDNDSSDEESEESKPKKAKLKTIDKALFMEIYGKYNETHTTKPKDASQLTTFAIEHGYNVRYGAITRGMKQYL